MIVLIFHQSVNMMLRPVFRGGNLEDICDAEERLLCVAIGDHLQDGEVLQHAVHHVLLQQILQLQDEVNHILAHGTAVYLVKVAAALKFRIFGLNLLHNLLAKTAHFCRALNRHAFLALVTANTRYKHFNIQTV